MLKSFCIKTNNKNIINYLVNNFENICLDHVYISTLKFKFYNNFIIHYTGKSLDSFYNIFSNIFSSLILEFYEKNIIKRILNINYFYFTDLEQKKILEIVNDYLYNNKLEESILRKESIKVSCIDYFASNKSTTLNGFVNFRMKDYVKILDNTIDLAVNKFIIDKEYTKFIDLLKSYIDSNKSSVSLVHLIYNQQFSILLDEFGNNIHLDKSILDSKYVSDISFSSNDYTLNALLSLLPKKIHLHLSNETNDDFINTLKILFNNRIYICNDCTICNNYKLKNFHK